MPMMEPGFILEALGSPLSPADPLPFSRTLQVVLSLPRKCELYHVEGDVW